MSFAPSTFRQQFPEFGDPGIFPDFQLTFWAGIAAKFVNANRWGSTLDYGLSLFVAHHIALAATDVDAEERGQQPGKVQGTLTSKSVDKVSASYDAASVSVENAGFWNMTRYGKMFYQLSMMMGAGGLQV